MKARIVLLVIFYYIFSQIYLIESEARAAFMRLRPALIPLKR